MRTVTSVALVPGVTSAASASLLLNLLAVFGAFGTALRDWQQTTFDGYLFVLVAIGLAVYLHRRQPPQESLRGAALVALAMLLVVVLGRWSSVESLTLLGFAGALLGLIHALLPGARGLSDLVSIAVILICGIPFWIVAVPLLQWLATQISVAALSLAAVPLWREGFVITVPNGSFLVDVGCSGFRYIAAAVCFAILFVKTGRLGDGAGIILTLTSAACAIVVNGLRIAIIIFIGNETHMQSELVNDHATLGWIVFAVVVMPACFGLGTYLERRAQPE